MKIKKFNKNLINMNSRVNDKVDEIIKYLDELKLILPSSFNKYLELKNKAACERYLWNN